MSFENVIARTDGPVGIVQLNRPQVLNALNGPTMRELNDALEQFEASDEIRVMIVTGNERAFAAGADIKEMAEATSVDMLKLNRIAQWDRLKKISKPIIAAVSGYALGGGCELAMACDTIVASETAMFGQPEINIGVMPGAGGTQRLTLALGKAKAMEMVLTGKMINAREAEARGLVARVAPVESYMEEALALAREIASRSPIAVRIAKEAVNHAFESSLTEGLDFERKMFYFLFSTEDQKEGMKAFIEKRKAEWKGK
jgi:enoyl-CoA hydratase